MKKIDFFRDEFRFLSNFYPVEIEFDGVTYPSVEHAYQAAKTTNEHERAVIGKLRTPGDAKRYGRQVKLRQDWENIKLEIMKRLLVQKFGKEPFCTMLLETGDAELIEGNYWKDRYWGVSAGEGQNRLGKMLMEIRENLRKEDETQ